MTTLTKSAPEPASQSALPADWLAAVRQKVGTLQHGSLQIFVHEGRVARIDKSDILFLRSAPRTLPKP